ncbi:protein translocase subunit SecF [Candidatus Parcubacteria bacterium]|nr:protein translocase subunit SecF [Candidatus Parcubacteria bacterium]
MWVVKYRKIWFTLSGVFLALSIFGIVKYGFNLSIDFKGGTITEVKYITPPTLDELNNQINKLNIGGFSIRPSGTNDFIIRTKDLPQAESDKLLGVVNASGKGATVQRQNTIGPIAGAELKSKAVKAIIVVIVMIVLFITFAFRGVSKPVSSWKYGLATVIALFHDVLIPLGVFVWLGHDLGYEIDLLFVTGLLAILGYSVHDTIVVFDRVRENLRVNRDGNKREEFEETVGKSVKQTFGRSINTSLTIFITLLALYLFGSGATREFALLLIIGVIVGTYSSIFVASPLLVTFYKWQRKDR